MSNKFLVLLQIILVFAIYSSALQLPYETAAVGRISGESVTDLLQQLDANSIAPKGATYFGDTPNPSFLTTSDMLTGEFGSNANIKGSAILNWRNWGEIRNILNGQESGKKNDLLILQKMGGIENGSVLLNDSPAGWLGTKITPSETNFDSFFNATKPLFISDTDFTGIYLPKSTASGSNSFISRYGPKSSAIIAPTFTQNTELVKSIVCSLFLQSKQGTLDGKIKSYYEFRTLGDRFRNARNNYYEFGSDVSELSLSGYHLYGLPYADILFPNPMTPAQLSQYCGSFANYNETTSSQTISLSADVGDVSAASVPTYSITASLDFGGSTVSTTDNYQLLEIAGTQQQLSYSSPVKPYAVTETALPLGTVVTDVNIVSKGNPIDLNLNLPSWDGNGFVQRNCLLGNEMFEFSPQYSEDKENVVVKVFPLEDVNCETGEFRLWRNIEYKIDYIPFSPLLIESTFTNDEYLPNENAAVAIKLKNITSSAAAGTLRITDGSAVVAEKGISVPAPGTLDETLQFPAPLQEGYYDYFVEFVQDNEVKTSTAFTINVEVLRASLTTTDERFIAQAEDREFGQAYVSGLNGAGLFFSFEMIFANRSVPTTGTLNFRAIYDYEYCNTSNGLGMTQLDYAIFIDGIQQPNLHSFPIDLICSNPDAITLDHNIFVPYSSNPNRALQIKAIAHYTNGTTGGWDLVNTAFYGSGSSYLKSTSLELQIDNKSGSIMPVAVNYHLLKGMEEVKSGTLLINAANGLNREYIDLQDLNKADQIYNAVVELSYQDKAKVLSTEVVTNNPPQIEYIPDINVTAFKTVKIQPVVTDSIDDAITVTISGPVGDDGVWITSDADVGDYDINVTANDRFLGTSQVVHVKVLPPVVECSVNLDCGVRALKEKNACSGEQLNDVYTNYRCNEAGTYTSYCESFEDYNAVGYCATLDNSSLNGNNAIEFPSAGTKTISFSLPFKHGASFQ